MTHGASGDARVEIAVLCDAIHQVAAQNSRRFGSCNLMNANIVLYALVT